MNENKYYRITDKINNSNEYSSPTVNNHHGNVNEICWPMKSFIIENRIWIIKLDNFIGPQSRPILHDARQVFVGRFYRETKSANFITHMW